MALVGELVGLLGRLPGPSRAVRLEAMPANHALTSRRPHAFPPFLRQFWEEFCTPGPQKQESNTTYSGVSLHQPWRRASEYSTHQHPSRLNFQKGLFTPVRTSVELHSKDMKRRKQRFEVQHLDGRVSQRDWTCVCTGPGRWGSFCPLKPFCWHSLITSQCYHQLRLESHSLAPKGREHSALRISP